MILHESTTSETSTSFSDFIRSIATDPAHKDAFEKCFRFYVPQHRFYDGASISVSTYSVYAPTYARPCDMLGYDKPTAIVKPDRTKYDRTNRTIEITDKHVAKFHKLYETFKENFSRMNSDKADKDSFLAFLIANGIETNSNALRLGRYSASSSNEWTVVLTYSPPYLYHGCDPAVVGEAMLEDARLFAEAMSKYHGKSYRPID